MCIYKEINKICVKAAPLMVGKRIDLRCTAGAAVAARRDVPVAVVPVGAQALLSPGSVTSPDALLEDQLGAYSPAASSPGPPSSLDPVDALGRQLGAGLSLRRLRSPGGAAPGTQPPPGGADQARRAGGAAPGRTASPAASTPAGVLLLPLGSGAFRLPVVQEQKAVENGRLRQCVSHHMPAWFGCWRAA